MQTLSGDPLWSRCRRGMKSLKNDEENGWWKQWFDVEGFGCHHRKLDLYSIFMGILANVFSRSLIQLIL